MAVRYPGRPLQLGARGRAVVGLQWQLKKYDDDIKVDGDYGPQTASIVEAFQRHRRLGTDGIVDHVIWNHIFGLPAPKLHPRRPETLADKVRRWRVETPMRRRQLKRAQSRERRRALRRRLGQLDAALRRAVVPKVAKVQGNRVVGGRTPRERVLAAAEQALRLYRAGSRPSYYSQPGEFTVDRSITGEPTTTSNGVHTHRSDCSQFCTGNVWSAGLGDPNGGGWDDGYTGSLADHGEEISWAEASREKQFPVAVIWDPWGSSGHVEWHAPRLGQPRRTIGHGSAPIAEHVVETFAYKPGGPRYFRIKP